MNPWIQHISGKNAQGQSICMRCGAEMNQLVPLNTVLSIRDGWISFGLRPDAILCKEMNNAK